jgi:hypothetical protein
MEKDPAITELLDWLRGQLGSAFTVADHWEADLVAVGISAPDKPTQLVYMCCGDQEAHYSIQLESAPPGGSDMPYQTVGKFDSVSRGELLGIVREHLGISK